MRTLYEGILGDINDTIDKSDDFINTPKKELAKFKAVKISNWDKIAQTCKEYLYTGKPNNYCIAIGCPALLNKYCNKKYVAEEPYCLEFWIGIKSEGKQTFRANATYDMYSVNVVVNLVTKKWGATREVHIKPDVFDFKLNRFAPCPGMTSNIKDVKSKICKYIAEIGTSEESFKNFIEYIETN